MAHGTATEVAAKWQSRIAAASTEMQAGVDRVSQAPGQAAAAKKQKWINRLMEQGTQDKWARKVAAVSLGDWQAAMKNYGIQRAVQGAQAKQAKYEAALGPLLSYIDQGRQQIRNMPDLTLEDRLQRSRAMQMWMSNYRKPAGQ